MLMCGQCGERMAQMEISCGARRWPETPPGHRPRSPGCPNARLRRKLCDSASHLRMARIHPEHRDGYLDPVCPEKAMPTCQLVGHTDPRLPSLRWIPANRAASMIAALQFLP